MTFDDSDIYLGDRIMAAGQPMTLLGAGGTGKSRLLLQLAACMTTGRKFIGFETRGGDLKWLFLQTENSNQRLKDDLQNINKWLGKDWPLFDAQVHIHTLENDEDGIVNLADLNNQTEISRLIEEIKPDIIAFDPLGDFGIGDLSKDVDMRETCRAITRICKKGNPNRAILVAHHAITGRAGASKATGFDRASFGRNSKVLLGWTRAQINVTGANPDNNETLIISCGKLSNGKEFEAFAVKLNLHSMIYDVDSHFDLGAWQKEISGKPVGPVMTPDRVRELCKGELSKPELAKAIMEDCGCARGSAYRFIERAEKSKKISQSKINDKYSRK